MYVKINFKETFLNELKKSNIKLCDFCQQKKLNRNLINKILIKSTWSSLFTENENVFFHVIENWLIDKQNKRAKRETFDVKELVSKFTKYADKNFILNIEIEKTNIESKKITALVKGSNEFHDLTDEQFKVGTTNIWIFWHFGWYEGNIQNNEPTCGRWYAFEYQNFKKKEHMKFTGHLLFVNFNW
jgi:hypothetical protein